MEKSAIRTHFIRLLISWAKGRELYLEHQTFELNTSYVTRRHWEISDTT